MRRAEFGRPEILQCLRHSSCFRLSELRYAGKPGNHFLPAVRHHAGRRRAGWISTPTARLSASAAGLPASGRLLPAATSTRVSTPAATGLSSPTAGLSPSAVGVSTSGRLLSTAPAAGVSSPATAGLSSTAGLSPAATRLPAPSGNDAGRLSTHTTTAIGRRQQGTADFPSCPAACRPGRLRLLGLQPGIPEGIAHPQIRQR